MVLNRTEPLSIIKTKGSKITVPCTETVRNRTEPWSTLRTTLSKVAIHYNGDTSETFEADSQQSTGSEDHSEENNDDHDDGDSDSTERHTTANQAVLVNDGLPHASTCRPRHRLHRLAICTWRCTTGNPLPMHHHGSSFWLLRRPRNVQIDRFSMIRLGVTLIGVSWTIDLADRNGNAQCTLVRRSDHRGSMMMPLQVAGVHLVS